MCGEGPEDVGHTILASPVEKMELETHAPEIVGRMGTGLPCRPPSPRKAALVSLSIIRHVQVPVELSIHGNARMYSNE